MSANYNLFSESDYLFEIKTQDKTFYVSETQWAKIQESINNGTKLIILGDKSFNPAYIKSVEKVLKNKQKNNQSPYWVNEEPKSFNQEKYEKLKVKIKEMLKKQNEKISSTRKIIQDKEKITRLEQQNEENLYLWKLFVEEIKNYKFPEINETFRRNYDITSHKQDRDSHEVEYLVKDLEIPKEFEGFNNKYWVQASLIWCPTCKSNIKKTINCFNQIEGICVVYPH